MFSEFCIEDLSLSLNVIKDNNSNTANNAIITVGNNGNKPMRNGIDYNGVIGKLCDKYRHQMMAFMKSVPHMTPTPFELNVRHNKVKHHLISQLQEFHMNSKSICINNNINNSNHIVIISNDNTNNNNENQINNCNNINNNDNNVVANGRISDELAIRQAVERCDNELDIIFKELAKDNRLEYRKCQLGFTIGWKCNVNQPNYSYKMFDDRF
ncbi:myb-like protein D [Oppia nitens]|uniref:myb-like protein D n=1 Tax=Oppia nitens TaxID=1686743 RepID=UPI0023DC05BE|nr:myb-like protein D [Oppia nitens]